MLAPIVLFTYNRLIETRQTVSALQHNYLASESNLIIFSDGGKDEASWAKVNAVRTYLKTIIGFKTVEIIESPVNKGLANSIISGVTSILEEHGKVIVLEDDLITSRNFLDYMNQALDFYEHQPKIQAISGYSYPLQYDKKDNFDASFGLRSYSWGWATWYTKWKDIDWEVKDYNEFINSANERKSFNRGGSDLSRMLRMQMEGKLSSWMIRWVYHQYKNQLYDVFPRISKVNNNGFTATATHTTCSPLRYLTPLDLTNKRIFEFDNNIAINPKTLKQVQRKISVIRRIKYRLMDMSGISNLILKKGMKNLFHVYTEPLIRTKLEDKAPVLLVIFNRPDTTIKVLEAIRMYQPQMLYVASDGARANKPNEKEIVQSTRDLVLSQVDWPCEVKTLFRDKNVGCGYGVSSAITWFLEQEEMGIILEDDCLPSLSFFYYCEDLLKKYKDEEQIKVIGGDNFQCNNCRGDASYYFSHYPTTWGWATWRRAWQSFTHDISDFNEVIDKGELNHFLKSKLEKKDWKRALRNASEHPEQVWDYHFFYNIWKEKGICITPNKNLVINLGFFDNATHYFLRDSTKTNVTRNELIFPLLHPSKIEVNKEADKYTFDHFYSHSVKRAIRLVIENDLKSIITYFKNRFRG